MNVCSSDKMNNRKMLGRKRQYGTACTIICQVKKEEHKVQKPSIDVKLMPKYFWYLILTLYYNQFQSLYAD